VTLAVDDALPLADRVVVLAGTPSEIAFTGVVGADATRAAIFNALGVADVGRDQRSWPPPQPARRDSGFREPYSTPPEVQMKPGQPPLGI